MTISKRQASRLLRPFVNIPARTISRTMKKRAIEDKLKDFNVIINIKGMSKKDKNFNLLTNQIKP